MNRKKTPPLLDLESEETIIFETGFDARAWSYRAIDFGLAAVIFGFAALIAGGIAYLAYHVGQMLRVEGAELGSPLVIGTIISTAAFAVISLWCLTSLARSVIACIYVHKVYFFGWFVVTNRRIVCVSPPSKASLRNILGAPINQVIVYGKDILSITQIFSDQGKTLREPKLILQLAKTAQFGHQRLVITGAEQQEKLFSSIQLLIDKSS